MTTTHRSDYLNRLRGLTAADAPQSTLRVFGYACNPGNPRTRVTNEDAHGPAAGSMRDQELRGTLQGAGGAGRRLAITTATSGTSFYGYDGHGYVTALVDNTGGGIAAEYKYDPVGNELRVSAALAKVNPLRFSGQYVYDVTGDLKYLVREYRPFTGRWLNRDPIGERGGKHLYGFVRNSPLGRIDSLGLCPIGESKLECTAKVTSHHPDSVEFESAALDFINMVDTIEQASMVAGTYLSVAGIEAWDSVADAAAGYLSKGGKVGPEAVAEAAIAAATAFHDHSIGMRLWTKVTEYKCGCSFFFWSKWEEKANSGWVAFNTSIPGYTALSPTGGGVVFLSRLHGDAKMKEACDAHMIDYAIGKYKE